MMQVPLLQLGGDRFLILGPGISHIDYEVNGSFSTYFKVRVNVQFVCFVCFGPWALGLGPWALAEGVMDR